MNRLEKIIGFLILLVCFFLSNSLKAQLLNEKISLIQYTNTETFFKKKPVFNSFIGYVSPENYAGIHFEPSIIFGFSVNVSISEYFKIPIDLKFWKLTEEVKSHFFWSPVISFGFKNYFGESKYCDYYIESEIGVMPMYVISNINISLGINYYVNKSYSLNINSTIYFLYNWTNKSEPFSFIPLNINVGLCF